MNITEAIKELRRAIARADYIHNLHPHRRGRITLVDAAILRDIADALDGKAVSNLVARLRDHENEGVTGSDRFHLRNEAADALDRAETMEAALRGEVIAQQFRADEATRLLRDYEAAYPHGRLGEAAREFFKDKDQTT